MRDLNLKRTINVLAWTTLSLGVIGCKKKEEEPPDFCEALRDCDREAFDDEYNSLKECQDQFDEYQEYATESYGAACGRAFEKWLECTAEVVEESCGEYVELEEECEDEYESLYDACYN